MKMKHLVAVSFLVFFSQASFAERVSLLEFQSPVKDQGNADTCAFFAVSALVESAFKSLNGMTYDISEGFESYRAKTLKRQRPEVEFGNTYDVLLNISGDLYVQDENDKRINFRGLKPKMLTKMWSSKSWSELIMAEIKAGRPVVITLKVAIPEINDAQGLIPMNNELDAKCARGEIACGGHAVLLIGFDSDKKLFFFKNSWGEKWGQKGYGFATFDQVDNYSDQPLTAGFDKKAFNLLDQP